jgi:polysaccharide export outer membrane protein
MMKPTILPIALALILGALPAAAQQSAAADAPGAAPARQSDSTAAAAERDGAASAAAYRLGPEDVIEVFVWKEPELSTTATVRPDGRITLPLVGELVASSKTVAELEEQITERLQSYIELPVVTVSVSEINSPKIAILGEVHRPGRYVIPQRTTVLDALAMGGGFTEYAKRDRVMVLRKTASGVQRIRVNVKQLLHDGGDPVYLQPGDTVHVD